MEGQPAKAEVPNKKPNKKSDKIKTDKVAKHSKRVAILFMHRMNTNIIIFQNSKKALLIIEDKKLDRQKKKRLQVSPR